MKHRKTFMKIGQGRTAYVIAADERAHFKPGEVMTLINPEASEEDQRFMITSAADALYGNNRPHVFMIVRHDEFDRIARGDLPKAMN
jgi:hypothetical protein